MTKQKVTRKDQGIANKRGAGRPKGNATIQINKRVPWQHYDNAKVLLDALVDCPSMIPDLLAVAKAHSSQHQARNHPHTGTVGN